MNTKASDKPDAGLVMRRLNVNLPEPVYVELQSLAKESGRSITDLMRMALGLVKIAVEETNRGNALFVGTRNGEPIKQLLIPK